MTPLDERSAYLAEASTFTKYNIHKRRGSSYCTLSQQNKMYTMQLTVSDFVTLRFKKCWPLRTIRFNITSIVCVPYRSIHSGYFPHQLFFTMALTRFLGGR